jgi:DNA-binding response OmpR family regulator
MTLARPDDSRRLRILVAEDIALVALTVREMLDELGVEVVGPADSVDGALDLVIADERGLDGALLDVDLGGESIFPVAEALRYAGCPFAFLTGYGREATGEYDVPVVTKPFGLAEVRRVIATFREHGRPGAADGPDQS